MRSVLPLLALAACLTALDVRVDASCPWEDKDGYTPVLVHVEALMRPVEVRFEARLGDSHAVDVLRVAPGQPVQRTMLIPSHGGWQTPVIRWVSSGGGRDEHGVNVAISHRDVALIVLDPAERVNLPDLQTLVAGSVNTASGHRGRHRSSGGDPVRRLAAEALPDRWQGWPAWATLFTTVEGEELLSPAQREAIATWSRAGGAIVVHDAASLAGWRRLGAEATLASDQPALLARLRRSSGESGRPTTHPVPGTDQIPSGVFLTLAIVFAVIAGPINLVWAMRRRQPWLLLVSTPLIATGACILLIAVALMSDGLGRRRDAVQMAVIDQTAQRTMVFSGATWFCGIAPGSFELDPEDRLLPHDEEDWQGGWRRNRPDLGLDWRAGQLALGGWIPARVNRQLAFTQARPERRRLTLVRDGDAWRLGNGLSVAIVELVWSDPAGNSWQVRDLAPGAEQPLVPAQRTLQLPTAVGHRLGLDARLAAHGLGHRPGTWLARLATPLHPIPGPPADDVDTPAAWAGGALSAEGR